MSRFGRVIPVVFFYRIQRHLLMCYCLDNRCFRDIVFIIILLALPHVGAASTLYKCRAADGTISFRDTPCVDRSATLDTRKLKSSRIQDVVDESEYLEPDAEPLDQASVYAFRAQFQQALSSLMPLRVASVEHFMTQGDWPKDFKAVDMDKRPMTSSLIESVHLMKGGWIVADLKKEKFGQQKKIVLIPTQVMGGTTVEWQCRSNFTSQLLGNDATRICESRVIN